MRRSDIPQDITMKLPLVLLRIGHHIIRLDKILRHLILPKSIRETQRRLLVLIDAEDADLVEGRGGLATLFLEGRRTAAFIALLRDGGADWKFGKGTWDGVSGNRNVKECLGNWGRGK